MNTSFNDAVHCLELAQLGNPLFRLSRVFAGERQELLTAVHAFFASVQIIGSSLQEEDVARRKIRWWQNECMPGNLAVSSHPVLREFERLRSGTDCHEQMQAILGGAERRLEKTPPSDEASLSALCCEIGEPLVDMEMAVCGGASSGLVSLDDLVMRRGLWTLVCESFGPKGRGHAWWLPLNLLARAGLSREEIHSDPSNPACEEIYKTALHKTNNISYEDDISINNQNHMNIYVLDVLVGKRLEKLSEKSPKEYPVMVQRTGISDLVTAWSAARKVSRQR